MRVSRFTSHRVSIGLSLIVGCLLLPLGLSVEGEEQDTARLVGSALTEWRGDTADWKNVQAVSISSENEKALVSSSAPGFGVIINGGGNTKNLYSVLEHGDVEVHVEFVVPKGSNSGVYLQGRYEIQVLDSWGVKSPAHSDCGGIYQRYHEGADFQGKERGYEGRGPRVNASKAPGEWQSFDITFRAPRFDSHGNKIANARFERVLHNGVVVHEDEEVTGPTRAAGFQDERPLGPLMLQGDHGPVAYRNITVTPIATFSIDSK